jgi:hypothetical protein
MNPQPLKSASEIAMKSAPEIPEPFVLTELQLKEHDARYHRAHELVDEGVFHAIADAQRFVELLARHQLGETLAPAEANIVHRVIAAHIERQTIAARQAAEIEADRLAVAELDAARREVARLKQALSQDEYLVVECANYVADFKKTWEGVGRLDYIHQLFPIGANLVAARELGAWIKAERLPALRTQLEVAQKKLAALTEAPGA